MNSDRKGKEINIQRIWIDLNRVELKRKFSKYLDTFVGAKRSSSSSSLSNKLLFLDVLVLGRLDGALVLVFIPPDLGSGLTCLLCELIHWSCQSRKQFVAFSIQRNLETWKTQRRGTFSDLIVAEKRAGHSFAWLGSGGFCFRLNRRCKQILEGKELYFRGVQSLTANHKFCEEIPPLPHHQTKGTRFF